MKIYKSLTELVGKTPLLELSRYASGLDARILAKLEGFNPGGSSKDRVAANMIADAERKGALKDGGTIIEPTSGNTGIGLAAIGAAKGYKVIIVMPDTMSLERQKLIAAYGAELVLTDGALGMAGAIEKANEIKAKMPNSIIAGQFDNPSNPESHFNTTGPEIWDDTDGQVDILVAGVGTGGTLSGVGKYLKIKNESVRIVAVEPADSPLLSKGVSGPHGIQGIGANFIPENLDESLVDEIIAVDTRDAYASARALATKEGILVGISSGAALYAASELARRPENKGKTIVALCADSGERYLSTDLFAE